MSFHHSLTINSFNQEISIVNVVMIIIKISQQEKYISNIPSFLAKLV